MGAASMQRSVRVGEADKSDLPSILTVQRQAFGRVARLIGVNETALPPLTETLSDLERLYDSGMRFFVAKDSDGRVIGSVRGTLCHGTVEIGRLVVATGSERRGVASRLMDCLEESFGDRRFVLFTGAMATGPLALYRNRGYREFQRDEAGGVELVWLERPASR